MIQICQGSLFDSSAQALVNPVNCKGAAGRGLAYDFRLRYPVNHKLYSQSCQRGEMRPGYVLFCDIATLFPPFYIINFPTKDDWRKPSQESYIRDGLDSLVALVSRRSIESVAIPPLGCGLGGLAWEVVRPLVVAAFDPLPNVNVFLYEPQ